MNIHTETFKNHTIRIVHDHDVDCPIDEYNNCEGESVIACIWQRDSILSDLNPFNEPVDAVRYASQHGYTVHKVRGYKHSGVAYSIKSANTYPFNCPWDSGFAGFVLTKDSDFKDFDAETIAETTMETITAWCNGEGCGFIIEDESGKEIDSCFGYIGTEYALECAKEILQ